LGLLNIEKITSARHRAADLHCVPQWRTCLGGNENASYYYRRTMNKTPTSRAAELKTNGLKATLPRLKVMEIFERA